MLFKKKDIKKNYRNGIILVNRRRVQDRDERMLNYHGQRYAISITTQIDYEMAVNLRKVTFRDGSREIGKKGLIYRAISPKYSPEERDNLAFQVVRNPALIEKILRENWLGSPE